MDLRPEFVLPVDAERATLVGRVFLPSVGGPAVVAIVGGEVIDVTRRYPTMRDLCEAESPVLDGVSLGPLEAILAATPRAARSTTPWLLAPVDLQAVKASGVTFAVSMLERVIEEQARGAPERAAAIRGEIGATLGHDIAHLRPGSPEASALKELLVAKGMWSQYLEVGIGPDAEIFTKAQPMAAVGHLAEIGIHPVSTWNNPEPEVVVIASSKGRIVGATLGNDVNLRDVEGRSALLLGRATDNNASAAIGPFVRLFDEHFGLHDVEQAEIGLRVSGADGFVLEGKSAMSLISRSPSELVRQTLSANHQYPDGLALYLGTMFAPVADRGAPGKGFTHAVGDEVTIASPRLGRLQNTVVRCPDAEPWTFGTSALFRNLAARGRL